MDPSLALSEKCCYKRESDISPFQTEYRRRLWSYLYHADRLYSLILGRPPSIGDSYTDTQPPSNVELRDFNILFSSAPPPQPRPLSEPTTATFLILRRSLSTIIGRIVHHFQKLNEPAQYTDVLRLQEEIDQFTHSLPRHFRMRDPDKSLDKTRTWLPVHRFLLLTEVLVTTIILHVSRDSIPGIDNSARGSSAASRATDTTPPGLPASSPPNSTLRSAKTSYAKHQTTTPLPTPASLRCSTAP